MAQSLGMSPAIALLAVGLLTVFTEDHVTAGSKQTLHSPCASSSMIVEMKNY
jgi:hypothetical protein